jgi:hypothetical protein
MEFFESEPNGFLDDLGLASVSSPSDPATYLSKERFWNADGLRGSSAHSRRDLHERGLLLGTLDLVVGF